MIKRYLLATMAAVCIIGTGVAFANVADVAKTEEVAKLVDVGNKLCPVSGEKIGQMGEVVKQEYNGKSYNLCCKMCSKDFSKDPEKYSKIAEDEVAKAQAEAKPASGT